MRQMNDFAGRIAVVAGGDRISARFMRQDFF
jgi:phage/plasmid-associated DNA primase